MATETIQNHKLAFKLKGNTFTLTTIQILTTNINDLTNQIQKQTEQAPKFFNGTPIVIDITDMASEMTASTLRSIIELLRSYSMLPVGIKGGEQFHKLTAKHLNLPTFLDHNKQSNASSKTMPTQITSHTKIIKQPVRSGQQLYAKGGDLIILSSISHGAECLADGNIHVYGTLRGRALAGVHGDTSAHIFCHNLEAELVSVAGRYLLTDYLKNNLWQQAVKIYLTDNQLNVESL